MAGFATDAGMEHVGLFVDRRLIDGMRMTGDATGRRGRIDAQRHLHRPRALVVR